MTDQRWQEVDEYLGKALGAEDELMEAVLKASRQAGLPAINVSPLQGKFLHILARVIGARRVLEVGTLAGYSAIWLGKALPEGGRVVTLEVEPRHAEVARANIDRAQLRSVIEVRVGPALESLAALGAEPSEAPFDLTFIDADKPNNAAYFDWALRLTRPGGVVVLDNVVRDGQVADLSSEEEAVTGTRRALEAMGAAPGVVATALQTVGVKGYDGFAIAVVGA